MLKAFCLVPDIDDSSVNVVLLSKIANLINSNSNSSNDDELSSFYYSNRNITHLYRLILKYSYKPFLNVTSHNLDSTFIDPRSFYILYPFLLNKKNNE